MRFLVKILLCGVVLFTFPFIANGQYSLQASNQNEGLPKVFTLGEYENAYEKVIPNYDQLLVACDNDMKVAFEKWLSMMMEMEAYAKTIDFDLKGIKLWIHVFWNANGSIEHMGYHLKPNSRNIDVEELNAFFSSFSNQYEFPLLTDSKFSHYTTVSFPVFSRRINSSTTKNDP
jgi:hypothetical protein